MALFGAATNKSKSITQSSLEGMRCVTGIEINFKPILGSTNQKIESREFFLRVLQYVGHV